MRSFSRRVLVSLHLTLPLRFDLRIAATMKFITPYFSLSIRRCRHGPVLSPHRLQMEGQQGALHAQVELGLR
jgi:hypothetical protein